MKKRILDYRGKIDNLVEKTAPDTDREAVHYIMHYYLLENETQKMYVQYDNILVHIQTAKIGRELQQEE